MLQEDSLDIKSIVEILAKSKKGKKKNNTTHKLLPFLLDILGEKKCISVLKTFAGECINFPSINSLIEAYFISIIWEEVNKININHPRVRGEKIKSLSKKYNCDAKTLYNIAKTSLK